MTKRWSALAWWGGGVAAMVLIRSADAGGSIWVGGTDLNWGTPANWQPSQVPGIDLPGVNVQVPSARGVVVIGLGTVLLGEVEFLTAVRLAGPTVTLQGGQAKDLELTNDAELLLLGPLELNGNGQWIHARIEGPATLQNLGTLTIPSTSQVRSLHGPLHNVGGVSQGGKITIGSGAGIINDGTWELTGAAPANIQEEPRGSEESFRNSNLLKRSGAGITEMWVPFTNQEGGAIEVQSGEILLKMQNTHEGGQYTLANGAWLRLWPDTAVTSEITGDTLLTGTGNVGVNGGSVHIASAATLTNQLSLGSAFGLQLATSGTITVDGTLYNLGKLTWDSGTLAGRGAVENEAGGIAVFTSPGTLSTLFRNLGGGEIVHNGNLFLNGGEVRTQAGSMWTVGNGSIFPQGAGGVIEHEGHFRKLGSEGNNTLIGVPVTVFDGAFEVVGEGELRFFAGGEWLGSSGELIVADTETMAFDGGVYTMTGSASVQGEGFFLIDSPSRIHSAGGTLTIDIGGKGSCGLIGAEVTSSADGDITIRNDSDLIVQSTNIGTATNQGGEIVNSRTMLFTGGESRIRGRVTNESDGAINQGADVSILGGEVVNEGHWTMMASKSILGSGGGIFRNQPGGTLQHASASAEFVTATLDNQGTVSVVFGTLTVTDTPQVQGDTLAGGTWEVHQGATLAFAGATVTRIGSGASVRLFGNGPSALIENLQVVEENGRVEFHGNDSYLVPMHEIRGTLRLQGVPAVESEESIESIDGEIEQVLVLDLVGGGDGGPRLITPSLINGGRIRPGGAGASGPFHVTGDLTQTAAGVIEIELGGATPIDGHDRLDVEGTVTLGGVLKVSLLEGFAPRVGESFEILSATGGIEGGFTAIESVGAGLFEAAVDDGVLVLTVTAAAIPEDVNGDGIVDGADLGLLLGSWGNCAGCPADLNDDGVVDGADLGLLLGGWTV